MEGCSIGLGEISTDERGDMIKQENVFHPTEEAMAEKCAYALPCTHRLAQTVPGLSIIAVQ